MLLWTDDPKQSFIPSRVTRCSSSVYPHFLCSLPRPAFSLSRRFLSRSRLTTHVHLSWPRSNDLPSNPSNSSVLESTRIWWPRCQWVRLRSLRESDRRCAVEKREDHVESFTYISSYLHGYVLMHMKDERKPSCVFHLSCKPDRQFPLYDGEVKYVMLLYQVVISGVVCGEQ